MNTACYTTFMFNKDLFVAVVVGGLFFVLGQYVASQPQRLEQEIEANREITVTGTGEVTSRPDIALLTLGVNTGLQQTAEAALSELAREFEAVVAAVKAQGVAEEDIKTTNLSINPRYNFADGRQTLAGFEASESIRVKVRELHRAGETLSAATREGVNQAGDISFEVDDPQDLQLQAQENAIRQARENAERLAEALDARLGKVKRFSSSQGGVTPVPIPFRAELGGDSLDAAPPINPGTQDIISTVTITYELR